jgi:hypothetical protein
MLLRDCWTPGQICARGASRRDEVSMLDGTPCKQPHVASLEFTASIAFFIKTMWGIVNCE